MSPVCRAGTGVERETAAVERKVGAKLADTIMI
jgi:hypothetical protein